MGLRWMLGKNLHTAYTARSKKLWKHKFYFSEGLHIETSKQAIYF